MTKQDNHIKITESPRESFQACKHPLSTEQKADYINILLKSNFDTIDIGSFVSSKAVPQLSDTAEILSKLNTDVKKSRVLVSIGNYKGAEKACQYYIIDDIGFLFSVSPTFLKLNINSNTQQALESIKKVNNLCLQNSKNQIVNLCLAFGNPYGDKFHPDDVLNSVDKLQNLGIKTIVLADTLACGDDKIIKTVFQTCISNFPDIDFGFHLHSDSSTWHKKLNAAYKAGCRNFDSVILGLGGCPMSGKEMINNLSTENLISFCENNSISHAIKKEAIEAAIHKAKEIF